MNTQPYISTMTTPPMAGFRIWFNNCGDKPHFAQSIEDGVEYNDWREWTAEDDEELKGWLQFEAELLAAGEVNPFAPSVAGPAPEWM